MLKADDISREELSFYRAIWKNPEDDAPRLVFADWLDEHARPEQAAYIRNKIYEYRNPSGELREPTGYVLDLFTKGVVYSRGMPSSWKCTIDEWYENRQYVCFFPVWVSIQDRIPYRAVDRYTDIPRRWVAWSFGGLPGSSHLPESLFDYMSRNLNVGHVLNGVHRLIAFNSTTDAFEALNLALLDEARTELFKHHTDLKHSPAPCLADLD